MSDPIAKRWSVTVFIEGEHVLTVAKKFYGGIYDFEKHRATIRHAAENLLALIGEDDELTWDDQDDDHPF